MNGKTISEYNPRAARESVSTAKRRTICAVFRQISFFAVLTFVFVGSAAAQEEIASGAQCASTSAARPAPATGGAALVGDNPLRRFVKDKNAENIVLSQVAVENQPFKTALRVETKTATKYPNQITLTAPSVVPIAPGDVLFLRWSVRTIKTAAPDRKGRAQLKTPAAFQGLDFDGAPEENWKTYALPVPSWRRFETPGALAATINLGGTAAQTIEIGGLELVNYNKNYTPQQLPFSCVTYEGRARDAAWRAEAEKRIELYRKGDLRVEVADENGNPVTDADVSAKMIRHEYGFGSAVNENQFDPAGAGDADARKYRQAIQKYFNETVVENGLKWANWAKPEAREKTLAAVDWLRSQNISVRGHTLVWASWRNSPKFLKDEYDRILAANGKPAANDYLRKTVEDHIRDEVSALRGRVADWDVVNETNANNDYMDLLGREVFPEWFRLARQADPNARLFLNENTVETETSQKTDFFYNEIKYLIDNRAPVGGIGIQAHVGAISIPSYLRNLDRFAKFNLPVKITEFDIVTPDEQLQAEFTADFLTATFSHPATSAFLMWGFWDGAHWLFDAPMFYEDWMLKPSGKAFLDLVFNKWWTNASGKTDRSGIYAVRGFCGDYEITVMKNGKKKIVPATLARDGAKIQIRLD